jgi:primosomal protein N' (replication factor Y)
VEPIINRIRNQYLMEMLLKLPGDGKLIAQCKKDLVEQIAILHNEKRFRSVVIVPDVDPV